MKIAPIVSAALLMAFGASCHDQAPIGRCMNDVTHEMSVSSGTMPTFNWTPKCIANYIWVYHFIQLDSTTKQAVFDWRYSGSVEPPLRYGQHYDPDGAPVPLIKGGRYVVLISGDAVCHDVTCIGETANIASAVFYP